MTPSEVPPSPANNDDDFEREQILYLDGPGDTTVRPVSAASLAIRERDSEQIAALLAWAQRQQEALTARQQRQPKPDEPKSV
jgi:hypothetical protein